EIDPELEVLPLHKQLETILLKESSPTTAGYYYYLTKDSHLKFLWSAYDDDDLQILLVTKSNYCLFGSARPYYNPKNCRSLPYLLGFIEAAMYKTSRVPVKYNILLEKKGKILPLKSIQALILEYKQLEGELDKNNINEEDLLKINIKNMIKSNKLGSMMLISTEQYLSLVLIQPCHSCNNRSFIDKALNVIAIGFWIKCKVKYKKCNAIFEHVNKTKEIHFAKAIAASGLAGGISYNAVQSALAIIGITNQISNKTYYHYQKIYFTPLRAYATSTSSELIYQEILPDYFHKPIVAFHIVEKTRFIKDNKLELTKTIHKGNFNKLSKQIEHAILIEVLNQVSSSLEEAGLHLEICIDGDLDSNQTLANVPIVSNVYTDLKYLTKNIRNSLHNHIMRWFRGCIYLVALRKVAQDSHILSKEETRNMQVEEIFRLPCGQGIVTLNQISQNEAFNCIKLGYTYLLSELREIYSGKPFENEDLHHISTIKKERSEKQKWNINKIQQCNQIQANNFTNEHKELGGFKFDKELVYYKDKAQNQLCANEFYLSFASLIIDFDITIRCISCHTFSKYAKGLCILCYIYQVFGWKSRILSSEIMKDNTCQSMSLIQRIEFIAEKIFKYTNLRSGQLEVIKSYIEERKDTLVVIKTEDRKSFCYVASAILFDGLTIVISSLKSLIQNQVLGIPYSSLLISSKETIKYESKLFDKIALEFTCLIYVTPEKLLLNKSLWKLYDHLYNIRKLQFVINEAHCIDMPDICLVIHYNFPMSMKDPISQPCNSCNNCAMHAKDKVELKDVKTEILNLLKVVEVLCENNNKPIVSLDIIDIFCLLNNTQLKSRKLKLMELFNWQKPKLLHSKFLAKLALADLVRYGFVNQTIWLEQKTSTAYLTSTIIIQDIVEDASSLVQEKTCYILPILISTKALSLFAKVELDEADEIWRTDEPGILDETGKISEL
ncbi:1740_t:CDS:10, partial [Gigaspora margarita]